MSKLTVSEQENVKLRVGSGDILPAIIEGISPEVDLTETDAGVRMAVTTKSGTKTILIPKGATGNTGATGTGIASVALNPDYTLLVTLTNGTSYLTAPIRGAQGETGKGIADIVMNGDYTLTITLDDGSYYTTEPIRGAEGATGPKGAPGATGATPQVGIGSVTTLPAGSSATASMSGTAEYPRLNLGIPAGAKGDKGDTGEVPIDDTAGSGDTDVVWSADKVARELANKPEIDDSVGPAAFDKVWSAGKIYADLAEKTSIDDYAGAGSTGVTWSADKIRRELDSKTEIDDTAGEGDTTKVWSADKSASELKSLKSDIEAAPTEETGQEMLEIEKTRTVLEDAFLDELDRIFTNLPQDDIGQGIYSELVTECDWLDMLYQEMALRESA